MAEALIDGTKIVITTLQKFPFVLRGLLHIAGAETQEKATDEERRRAKEWEAAIAERKYAVIVDEAHSSQTGETARELKAILGKTVVAGSRTGLGKPVEPGDAVSRTPAEPQFLCLYGHPEGQDVGTVWTDRHEWPARGIPHPGSCLSCVTKPRGNRNREVHWRGLFSSS
jgi:hypothetical protein